MKVKVYHHTSDIGWTYCFSESNLHRLSETNPSAFILNMEYEIVAEFKNIDSSNSITNVLNNIYERTNHIDTNWTRVDDPSMIVTNHDGYNRSTSVGDLIRVGDELYIVESSGFRLLGEK